MNGRDYLWKILCFGAFLFLLSGCQNSPLCTDQLGCISLAPGEPLTIGVERATVGNERFASQAVIEGINIAANLQPRFNGHPVQFYYQDTTCTVSDQNFTTGLLISQPKLVAVFGPVCQAGTDAYAKLISDAGVALLSPATSIGPDRLPGAFNLFPSYKALASGLDSLLSKSVDVKNIDLIIWNAPYDIQFSNEFCNLWEKRELKCEKILLIGPENLDIENIAGQIAGEPASLIFILPFSYINSVPGFRDLLNLRTAIFFDPELAVWDESQDPYSSERMVITYHRLQAAEKMGFGLYGNYPEISSLFAYDTYDILLKSLTGVVQMTPDGQIIIYRQQLRNSIEKMADSAGLAGNYSCSGGNGCLRMDNFLEARLPIH